MADAVRDCALCEKPIAGLGVSFAPHGWERLRMRVHSACIDEFRRVCRCDGCAQQGGQ